MFPQLLIQEEPSKFKVPLQLKQLAAVSPLHVVQVLLHTEHLLIFAKYPSKQVDTHDVFK